jgi:hypothetical protein
VQLLNAKEKKKHVYSDIKTTAEETTSSEEDLSVESKEKCAASENLLQEASKNSKKESEEASIEREELSEDSNVNSKSPKELERDSKNSN